MVQLLGRRGWLCSFDVDDVVHWRCRHPSPSGSPGPPFALLVLPWLVFAARWWLHLDRYCDYDRLLDYMFNGVCGDFSDCDFVFGADLRAAAPGGQQVPKGPRISTGDAQLVRSFYDSSGSGFSVDADGLQHVLRLRALRLRADHRAAAPGGRGVPKGPRKSTGDAQMVGFFSAASHDGFFGHFDGMDYLLRLGADCLAAAHGGRDAPKGPRISTCAAQQVGRSCGSRLRAARGAGASLAMWLQRGL